MDLWRLAETHTTPSKSAVLMWDFCLNYLCSANKTYAIRLRPSAKQLLIYLSKKETAKRSGREERKVKKRIFTQLCLRSLQSISHFLAIYIAANICFLTLEHAEICHIVVLFNTSLFLFFFYFIISLFLYHSRSCWVRALRRAHFS